MFGKAKELMELQKKAKEIQKKLQSEVFTVESGAVKITINGEQKIQKVELNKEDIDLEKLDILEKDIKTAVESGVKQSQEYANKMLQEMGGLGDLLKGM
jgi:DNA-binding protein YbaB